MKALIKRPRLREWEAVATVLAVTIAAMYGGNIHVTLKNPVGRQKKAPVAMAAPAISICLWPWSRGLEMKPSIGAAKINPISHEKDVHSNGENFELLMPMDLCVRLSYLQIFSEY